MVSSVCVIVRLMRGVPGEGKWLLIAHSNVEDTATKLHLHNTELNQRVSLPPPNGIMFVPSLCTSVFTLAENFPCINVKPYLFKKIDFLPRRQLLDFQFISVCCENKFALTRDFRLVIHHHGSFLAFYFLSD